MCLLFGFRARLLRGRLHRPPIYTLIEGTSAVVAIALSAAEVRFTVPGGQAMEISLNPGQAMYMDAADHATEILSSSEAHVILVELK